MSTRIIAAGLIVCVLTAAGGGCGPSGPAKRDVSGTVSFDGRPVAEGAIVFVPDDKSVGPEGGPIKDGRYTLKARDGVNTVRIQATRAVPGKKGPMGEEFVEQYIPERYNEKTKLTAEVGPGKAEHNFDLKK